jgi:transposase InsO family protein
MYINPGCPWENPYIERFNGTLKDELLNREMFYTLKEAQAIIENYRVEYNKIRPHSSLNYLAPESFILFTQTLPIQLVQNTGA